MAPPHTLKSTDLSQLPDTLDAPPVCVMTFNANDPSGIGGLTADLAAMASAGTHPLAVVTGAYGRDTSAIFDHFAFSDDAVTDQARGALEDIPVAAFKVGFVGSPENVSAIAEIASDYADVPLVAYMPDLSWWDNSDIDDYLDAYRDLILPQASLLIGNYSSLWRWLLPDWPSDKPPSARDIAKAADALGVTCTLVTGIALPDQFTENVLATPLAVLYREKFERFEATFSGAGETLSAAIVALLGNGHDVGSAVAEALTYLDHSLEAGYQAGMGHLVPDRFFWAQGEDDDDAEEADDADAAQGHPLPDTTDPFAPAADAGADNAAPDTDSSANVPPLFPQTPHGNTQH